MTEIVERTETHVLLEDEDGDRRFVLTRCPACGVRFVGDEHNDASALLAETTTVRKHLADEHNPECFGLSPLRRPHQTRLTAVGGETA